MIEDCQSRSTLQNRASAGNRVVINLEQGVISRSWNRESKNCKNTQKEDKTLNNVDYCWNIKIKFYLETSSGQECNQFSTLQYKEVTCTEPFPSVSVPCPSIILTSRAEPNRGGVLLVLHYRVYSCFSQNIDTKVSILVQFKAIIIEHFSR